MALNTGGLEVAERVADSLEIIAIVIIAAAAIYALVGTLVETIRSPARKPNEAFLHRLSGGLLIGLDLMVAADIIRTVTLDRTLEATAGLGLIVLIRTFLTWTITAETEGRWPTQARREDR